MIPARRELPGNVLTALRLASGFTSSVRAFADSIGMSDDTLRRLEAVTWGTVREDWVRAVDRRDLDALVSAKWVTKGDDWWMRFMTAFTWQQLVIKYGKAAYELDAPKERILEPVLEAHVIALVQEITDRYVPRPLGAVRSISVGERQGLVQRVCGEVLFRLATTGLIRTPDDDGPDGPMLPEQVPMRGLDDAGSGPEVPPSYLRTLRLAYDIIEEELREALDQETLDQDRV